jgi:PAS domain S-box-containing protein
MRKSTLPSLSRSKPARTETSAGLTIDDDHLSPHQTKNLIHELQVHQIELKMQNEELRRTQAELEASHARYFDLYDLAPVGYITVDESGLILESNLVAATILDVPKDTLVRQPLTRFVFKEDQDLYYKHRKQLFGAGKPGTLELRMVKKDGSPFWTRLDSTVVRNAGGMTVCRVVVSDITERRRIEDREMLTREVLELVNRTSDTSGTISDILKLVKKSTSFEAVGIRLRDGDDYPYYETNGFPVHFVESERSLCAYDEKGCIIRDNNGNAVLECMCGNVIRGRTDPSQPFFTRGGSFWSNGTTELLASTTEKDRQARTRNRCNGEGYESVALIPLRSGNEIVGLLQLNDHQKGRFTLDVIQFFEGLGAVIGIALAREQTRETLLREKEFNASLINTTQAIILVLDTMGRIVQFNSYMEEISGYGLDEIRGKDWFDSFLPASERDGIRNLFHKAIGDIPTRGNVSTIVTKDGTKRKIEWYDKTLKNADGSIIGLLSTGQDITERRKAEEDLVFKNIILSTQQDASIDGILVVDGNGMMISFNRRFVDMWGLSLDVVESKSDERALQSVIEKLTDPEEFMGKVKHLYNARKETSRDDITLKDGRTFDRYSAPMFGVGEKYYGRVWYFRDITDRKQAEEKQKKLENQLRQSQKLEAIGQLSSGVAHDFNNLLGGIMGHAELLKMSLNPESPLMRHPEVIISACEKAADLTRQLLSFARKAPVEFRKLDLNAFLKQVVGLMDRTIDRRIEIVTNIPEQAAFISGDRNQLENALLNIAINARDAMPEGGHLCISLKTVDLSKVVLPDEHAEIIEGPYARISIVDTGTGMSNEIKDRIFEPFFTTKEVGKGTGLGLASAYGCVKQHKGYIAVQSQVGRGTQFDLYFPIVVSGGPAAGQKSEILVRGKGTLLVVDDEPVFHEILTKIFTGLGYGVRCCAGGAEAVEYYREHASGIAVVVLDMNMPKMSGRQCFRLLKEINPEVRAIIASGYGDNSDRAALQEEGVRAIIQKPYKAVELSMKIAELVGAP